VSWPRPARLLRHRPPALLLERIAEFGGDRLRCTSRGAGPWRWAELLEGAAQSAGLLAGLQPGGPANTAVIAEYRSVGVHAATHTGAVAFVACLERRILDFWRCRVEARAADGTLLLDGRVTIAPR
jgi:predicted hotdog family 3-hydroxylacyl-ACP dehydratase